MKAKVMGLFSLAIALAASQPARAAFVSINDAVPDPNIVFSLNDFEEGFQINGLTVEEGLRNPKTVTISELAQPGINEIDGAAENDFSAVWILGGPIVPENETVFFTEPGGGISDVLHFSYTAASDGVHGHLDGSVISDTEAPLSVADLNAAGIVATKTLSEATAFAGGKVFAFSNTNITANFTSDVPEASTWAMLLIGFAGLGLAGYRASRKSAALA